MVDGHVKQNKRFTRDFTYESDDAAELHLAQNGVSILIDENHHLVKNGCVTMECEVEILSISGNSLAQYVDFHDKVNGLSDVTFEVEGALLYANKAMLAKCSPVFYDMFYKNHQNEIRIENVKYADFEAFLQFMYLFHPQITESNIDALLLLAFQYQVPMITDKCEAYLISSQRFETGKKLKYAEDHQLKFLENRCFESLNSLKKLREVCEHAEFSNKSTSTALMAKMMEFMKKGDN